MLVDRRNLRIKEGTRALSKKWIGPYTVTEVISRHSYRLNIPKRNRLHPVIYTALLKPFHTRSAPQLVDDIEDEDIEYDVERIIDSRKRRGKVEYRIRWEGYEEQDDTWETFEQLACPDKLQQFHTDNSRKPRDPRIR